MKINLAGHNADRYFLKKGATPETLSAAYARISRSEDPVDVIRDKARRGVAKARRSNQNIIGMGHHSVAEHAVFNFDVIGISRLAKKL